MLDGDPSISHYQLYHDIVRDLASPAGIFRGGYQRPCLEGV